MSSTGPLDLDAIADDGEPFVFVFGGREFTFPADPEVKAWEYLAKGDTQMCLWVLLGADEYTAMDSLDAKLTTARFKALLDGYQKHLGIDPGKSSGPSASSRRTVPR